MKLNYEQLIKALDAGEVVEVRDIEDNKFACLGGCGKDGYGYYRCSVWSISIEKARQYKGDFYGYTPDFLKKLCDQLEYLDSYAWAITDPIPGRSLQFETSDGHSGVRSEKIYQCPYCKTVVIY